MGCSSSKTEDFEEIFLEEEFAPTVISSLNASTTYSLATDHQKNKSSMYSFTKFLKIRSISMLNLKNLPNFAELVQILDIWEHEVYEKLEELVLSPAELSLSIAESTDSTITIIIKAEGIRKFSFFYNFIRKIQKFLPSNELCLSLLQENSEFIVDLAPLTVSFFLTLAEEFDFGIGVNKPIDRKNLSRFLQNCNDRKVITEWSYLGNMPIPISFEFSCVKPKKSCCFYIFDGEKSENFQRAFAIFDAIGAPVQESVQKKFFHAKNDEAFCKIVIEKEGITQVCVDVANLEKNVIEDVLEMIKAEFPHKGFLEFQRVALQLNKNGVSIVKYTDI